MQVHSRIIKRLDPQDYRVIVATNRRGDSHDQFRKIDGIDIRLYNLGVSFNSYSKSPLGRGAALISNLESIGNIPRLIGLIWKERVKVIHSASAPRMVLLGAALALLTPAKLVVHVHEKPSSLRGVKRVLVKWASQRAKAVITVSKFIARDMEILGVDSKKIWPVLNTVDAERFNPHASGEAIRREFGVKPDELLVVVVGRIVKEKGQWDLIEAMAMVKERCPKAKALLVGWSPPGDGYLEELRSYRDTLGLADTVIFGKPRTDIPEVTAAADVVAVPSTKSDPCPLVVLEAMASGKPVVGTITGGIPEMLVEGTGLLAPPREPAALAGALITLLSDASLRRRLGEAARRRVERDFYEGRLAEQVSEVYRAVVGSEARQAVVK